MSFAGYVAIRFAGASLGVLLSGLAGGLVSSTAVTLNMARLAREHPEREKLFAAAIMLASAVMMLRVLVLVGLINMPLLQILAVPLLLAVLAQAGVAGLLGNWARDDSHTADEPLALKNPFDLSVVLEFGALLAIIMALAKGVAAWAGSEGAYALAAVSGLLDVDAISLSLARLAPGGLDARSAGLRHPHRGRGQQRGQGGAGLDGRRLGARQAVGVGPRGGVRRGGCWRSDRWLCMVVRHRWSWGFPHGLGIYHEPTRRIWHYSSNRSCNCRILCEAYF